MECLALSFYKTILHKKFYHLQKETLVLSFKFASIFISSPCHMALAKSSSTLLNRSRESGQSCPVSHLSRNVEFFLHLV